MEASSHHHHHHHDTVENLSWASDASRRFSLLALGSNNVCCRPSDRLPRLLFSAFSARLHDLSSLFKELQHESQVLGASLSQSNARRIEQELLDMENLLGKEYSSRCSLYLLLSFPYIVFRIKRFYATVRGVIESLSLDERWSSRVIARLSAQKNALTEGFGSIRFNPKDESLLLALQRGNLDLMVCEQIADCLGFESSDYTHGFLAEVMKLKMERKSEEDGKHNNVEHYVFIRKCIDVLEKSLCIDSIDETKNLHGNGLPIAPFSSESNERKAVPEKALFVDPIDESSRKEKKDLLEKGIGIELINHSRSKEEEGSLDKGLSIEPIVHSRNNKAEASLSSRTTLPPLESFICPITQEVLLDPVQIASEQAYERPAIETWVAGGRCPSGIELSDSKFKPHTALKQSIVEQRERNDNVTVKMACNVLHRTVSGPGSKEDYMKALQVLVCLCEKDSLLKQEVVSENVIPLLVQLAEANDCELRQKAISLLDVLAVNEECQEIMLDVNLVEIVVRSLARQSEEAPWSIQLLCTLSHNKEIAERISRTPSVILFLVTFIDNPTCTDNVNTILENLPKYDENAVIMAELNIMEPLIARLQEGETESRVLMANTLGRLRMSDVSMTKLVEASLQTLVQMVRSLNDDERKAAVMALEKLSPIPAARVGLQKSGGTLDSLVRILEAGVRDSLKTRQGCATILSNVWSCNALPLDDSHILEAVKTYLGLLRPPTPMRLQLQLLQGLLNLAQCQSSSSFALPQLLMKDFNAFPCLFQLYIASDDLSFIPLRCLCLQLLTCVALKFPHEAASAILAQPTSIPRIANLFSDMKRENELKLALSFISCLPSRDTNITKLLLQEHELLPTLINLLKSNKSEEIVMAAVTILLRFTLPSDKDMQASAAMAGAIEVCIGLLRSSSGVAAKEKAVKALCNFSMSTWELSKVENRKKKKKKKKMGCFGSMFGGKIDEGKERIQGCRVHGGDCSVEGTFCLVEAGALPILLDAIRETRTLKPTSSSMEASLLMAIGTLLIAQKGPIITTSTREGSIPSKTRGEEMEQVSLLEGCCKAIEEAGGFGTIIALMSSEVPQVQELASRLCEKLFSVPDFRSKYGAQAQPHIVTLLYTCPPNLKQLAGRLLRHLELLQTQSSTSLSSTISTTSSLFGSSPRSLPHLTGD